MIAVDTNVLVYAHRVDSPHHDAARELVTELATGGATWGIPWPCIHEFLAVTTHPRTYQPPSPAPIALEAVRSLTSSGRLQLLAEGPDHLRILRELMSAAHVVGPRVHDARIAAICLSHGVDTLWSADRDFSWFPALRVANPLTA